MTRTRKSMKFLLTEASLGSVAATPPLSTLASQVRSRAQLQFLGQL